MAFVTAAGLLASQGPAAAATCDSVLLSTRDLSSFATLVHESGLASTLQNSDYTIFAPTNEAISHIAVLTHMLEGEGANASPDFMKLQVLVRAHLVSGKHPEEQMHGKVELRTEAGTVIDIDGTTQRGIMLTANARNVNLSGFRAIPDVHVTGPAVACDRGVIYPIDNALVQ